MSQNNTEVSKAGTVELEATTAELMTENATVRVTDDTGITLMENDFYVHSTTMAVYICIGLFGMAGNGFAIFVLSKSVTMRKKLVNVFLINQSAVDLLTSLFLVLMGYNKTGATIATFSGARADFYCKVMASRWPLWGMIVSSTWNLALVNLERYISIAFPIYHKTSITKWHIVGSLVFIWMIGPLVKAIVLLYSSGFVDGKCKVASLWPNKKLAIFGSAFNISMQYFIPLAIMVCCYILMIKTLHFKSKVSTIRANPTESSHQVSSASKSRNILRTLAVVTLAFIFCLTLNNFFFLLYLVGSIKSLSGTLYHTSVYLVFLNCCLNPIIYSAQYREFQQQMRKLFCKSVQGQDFRSGTHSTDMTTSQ